MPAEEGPTVFQSTSDRFGLPAPAAPTGRTKQVRWWCIQLHKDGSLVWLYTRNGYDCTTTIFSRLVNYYALEWGRTEPPPDPTAPALRRSSWSPAPLPTPPYPFTEWPYGGTASIGVTRPNSVDSPLMVALSNTEVGKAMSAAHIQVYGWISAGGNLSTNTVSPGGNWPAGYMYTPNIVQLDQAVMYVERLPDTVQKDHVDWGFRVAGLYHGTGLHGARVRLGAVLEL